MKIMYMGTPDFAVPALRSLIAGGHEVCAVYTQPDKPKGRKQILTPPPVKETATSYGIPVFQPESFRDKEVVSTISDLAPDAIVVAAYGKLLPQSVLDIPKYGCLNIHASLLPKYRGAAPIQWAIVNGEKTAGVTIMQMDAGLDTGDMLLKSETQIGANENADELTDRLSRMGADLILDALKLAEKGELTPEKQDNSQFTYAPMLNKSITEIDWTLPANDIHNKIRGLSPWPVATSVLNGKRVKIYLSEIAENAEGECGEILSLSPITVACGGSSALKILEIQGEGGKRLKSDDFARGQRLEPGCRFSERN